MLRLLRIWTLALLAVALPLQTMAAVTMLHCMGNLQTLQTLTNTSAAPSNTNSQAVYGAPDAAVIADEHCHPNMAREQSDVADGKAHQCSACAACHVGAALMPSAMSFEQPPLVPLAFATISAGRPAFLTEGPERPPRLSPI